MNSSFRVPVKAGGGMPSYQQQQQYPTPGVDTSARLSDSAAQIYQQGADQQAKGLEKLGQGLEQASKAGYDLYTDYQTSKAKDAWLQYKQGAQKLQAQLGSLSGKDAIDESNGVVAQLKSWREQARGEISGKLGSMAAGLFDRAASETDATLDAWATGKVHAEAINYGNATSKANISLAQNQAVADAANPAAFGAQMGVVKAELENMAKRSGYGAGWVQAGLQDMQQKTLTQAISDRIAGEDLGTANSMIKAYGPLLGGNADGLRARAVAKGRELEARARADQERTQRLDAMNTARTLLNDFGGNSDQALDWINKNAKGTEQQLQYTSAYLTQRNILDAANAQRKQESTIATQNDITSRIQAAGTDVNALNTIIAEAPPEFKNFATVHAEQAVGKQRRTISDPTAWNDAHSAILRGEPYDIVMGRNVGKISDPDSDKLKNLAEDKAAREAESKDDLYFNSIFARSQFAKLDAGERAAARAQLKQEAFDQTRGVRTLKERQEIIFRLLADRSVPGTFLGDFSPNTITSIKARDKDQSTVRFAVPDDAKELIKKNFAKQGEPNPSDSQIREAFELYHKQYGY